MSLEPGVATRESRFRALFIGYFSKRTCEPAKFPLTNLLPLNRNIPAWKHCVFVSCWAFLCRSVAGSWLDLHVHAWGSVRLFCIRVFPSIQHLTLTTPNQKHHGGYNMKYKSVSTIAAILCGCFLALVASITACSQEQRTTIHIEGTIADDQGNAMNGVSAYVTFSRRRAENRYSELQSFDETINSSFRFEGKGDRIDVTFARKGYAPQGLLLNRDDGDLILRDLRIVMKKTTPEEIAESLFEAMDALRGSKGRTIT